jgi:5'-nucleotidase
MARHPSGKIIPIVHAYAFGKYLGKLRAVFDDDGNAIPEKTYGNPILLKASIPEGEQRQLEGNCLYAD